MPCFLAQSLTAGRNMATTGVLFMNGLTKVTGNIIFTSAPVTDFECFDFDVAVVAGLHDGFFTPIQLGRIF